MNDRRQRPLAAEVVPLWCAPTGRIEVVGPPSSVPHTCHDEGTTAVMSSHSKARPMAHELDTSSSALTEFESRSGRTDEVPGQALVRSSRRSSSVRLLAQLAVHSAGE